MVQASIDKVIVGWLNLLHVFAVSRLIDGNNVNTSWFDVYNMDINIRMLT